MRDIMRSIDEAVSEFVTKSSSELQEILDNRDLEIYSPRIYTAINDILKSRNELTETILRENCHVEANNVIVCPKCRLNDKIEKTTTIVLSQTSFSQAIRPVTDVYSDSNGKIKSMTRYVSTSGSDQSALANILDMPALPPEPYSPSVLPLITFISLTIIMFFILTTDAEDEASLFFFAISIISTVVSFAIYKARLEEYERSRITYRDFIDQYDLAKKKYDNLYYCYRDDCIFFGGERDYESPRNLASFVGF